MPIMPTEITIKETKASIRLKPVWVLRRDARIMACLSILKGR
jgi:hypothetical protein